MPNEQKRPPNARKRAIEHIELLNQVYGKGNWHGKKDLAGYSGAGVYQVTVDDVARIVKITYTITMRREYAHYKKFVEHHLRNLAPTVTGEPKPSQDGQIALLEYTYAGVKRSQTLYEYLQDKDGKTIHKILHEIFHIHGKAWWGNAKTSPTVQARRYYDRFLPVNLQIGQIAAPLPDALLLNAKHCDRESLANLPIGQPICLQGWTIEKQEDEVLTVYTEPSDEPRLRIQVSGGHGQPETMLTETYGYVKETRPTLLAKYAKAAIPTFDIDTPDFLLNGQRYANPLYYYQTLLDGEPYEAKVSTIHGDLNLRNILVEEDAQTKRYWLIDFATTGLGPVLLDLQWLETQVILWLLVPALSKAHLDEKTLITVLEALHKGTALPWHLRYKLRMPFAVLKEIRQVAEGYLADAEGGNIKWQEYYRGLTLTLLGTLKHQALRDELGPDAQKFALIGAATTLLWSGVKLPPSPTAAKSWLRYGIAGLLGVILGGGLTYGILRLSLKPMPLLAEVKQRGHVNCGVNGELPFFSWDQANTKSTDFYANAVGFDADFCRVVAIAIWGDKYGPDKVRFKNLTTQNRFTVLNDRGSNGIDVLFRNSTRSPDREGSADEGGANVDFDAVNFYAQQGYMVHNALKIKTLKELNGKEVCVLPQSAPLANLAFLIEKQIKVIPKTTFRGNPNPTNREIAQALADGTCKIWASDLDQLLIFRRQPSPQDQPDMVLLSPNDYSILPDLDSPLQPRGPAVPVGDSQWRKVVSYAVWATIYAEELGITQAKARSNTPCEGISSFLCKQFLGIDDPQIPKHIGEYLGLPKDFARQIIMQQGNYSEIFSRHLGPIITERGPNQVRTEAHPEGLLLAPPFVLSQLASPTPTP